MYPPASTAPTPPVRLAACECLTALGDTRATHAALLRGETALRPIPVLGREGGDPVPLALLPERAGHHDEQTPPVWLVPLRAFLAPVSGPAWGTPRRPVIVTSSNFGVGSLYAHRRSGTGCQPVGLSGTGVPPVGSSGTGVPPVNASAPSTAHAAHGSIHASVANLRAACNWGDNITIFSHACVSAHLGLIHAARLLAATPAGTIDAILHVTYDFVTPFVAGGFHSLKILNTDFPAPYANRPAGSIALGDGAAYAILTRDRGDYEITAQTLHNEMHHPTANHPDATGFAAALAPLARAAAAANLRVWIKGHGTGTLDAGRLEATATAAAFPDSPLTGWKGALGHTLGSCGLVELALAAHSLRAGHAPATIGTTAPTFAPTIALSPINTTRYNAALCASNAFGGAHAALILTKTKARAHPA